MALRSPAPRTPTGVGAALVFPVLVMTLTFSRFLSAVILTSRQSGDLPAVMWQLIASVGGPPTTLVRDGEPAIAQNGSPSVPVAWFAGTLASVMVIAPHAPVTGQRTRARLPRGYDVRVDGNDQSSDSRASGRLIDVTVTPTHVRVLCEEGWSRSILAAGTWI